MRRSNINRVKIRVVPGLYYLNGRFVTDEELRLQKAYKRFNKELREAEIGSPYFCSLLRATRRLREMLREETFITKLIIEMSRK